MKILRYISIVFFEIFFFAASIFAQTYVTGNVSGVWTTEDSPYIVTGRARVYGKLIINPGVEIKFNSGGQLFLYPNDTLIAVGESNLPILFTSNQTNPSPGDWSNIGLAGNGDRSVIKHAIIEYAIYGVSISADADGCEYNNNYARLDSCIIRYCANTGIWIAGRGNTSSGCTLPKTGNASPEITNNWIYENVGHGIELYARDGYNANGYVGASIERNIIENNNGNGIYCFGSDPVEPSIINNTIVGNVRSGISFNDNFDSTYFEIVNNIIIHNDTGINSIMNKCPDIKYNDVWSNDHLNYQGISTPELDLSLDPMFIDMQANDFNLQELSPCIDAGDTSIIDPDRTQSDIGAIYYKHLPEADFEADTFSGNTPFEVQFTDNSIGVLSTWLWNFGDGDASNQQNPSHIYNTTGEYTVSLTVTGEDGTDMETKTDYIHVVTTVPIAEFNCDVISGIRPLTVNFTDNSENDVTSWSWNFGDGSTSSQQNPSHTYSEIGVYTISLTVTGEGGTDTETKTNFITVEEPAPISEFSSDITSGIKPLNVNFTDESENNVTSWSWDFGDGNTSTQQNPSHTYNEVGEYTVSLTVSGDGGTDTETKTNYISIEYSKPTAAFSANITEGEPPLDVSFTDNSTGDIYQWSWDLGDGSKSLEKNPSHTYEQEGIYTVILIVTGEGGTDTLTKANYITVDFLPPVAMFSADTTNGNSPLTVKFTDNSVGNVSSWFWDFGDNNTSSEQDPIHTYSEEGTYNVALTVTGEGGTDTDTKSNYIIISSTTIIKEKFFNENIFIYPNPADILCNIWLECEIKGEIIIKIYDSHGRKVFWNNYFRTNENSSEFSIDVSNLPVGVYYVSITFDSYSITKYLHIFR